MKLFAGTSGYGFREWVGTFYPKGTRPAGFLTYYASMFRSVEINYTFRRFPNAALAEKWRRATPQGFRFAVKAHQSITHRARLADAGRPVADFLKALEPLGTRLGPVLFQCPPWFRRNDERFSAFLAALPRDGRFAFEFRHPSWHCEAVAARCREAGTALVTGIPRLDRDLHVPVTTDFAYLRLRQDPPYTPEEERRIVALLAGLRSQVEAAYLYVKHDGPGLAPGAAAWIRDLETVEPAVPD